MHVAFKTDYITIIQASIQFAKTGKMVTIRVQLIRKLMETVYLMVSYRTEKVVSSHGRFTLPKKTKLKTITGLGLTY